MDRNLPNAERLIERAMPSDVQAEYGVLGSIILLPSIIHEIARSLTTEDFYDDANQKIFAAMLAMRAAKQPIDGTLLIATLKDQKQYEAIGGMAGLAKIINAVPHAGNARFYAEEVIRHSLARRLIERCTVALADAYGGSDPAKLVRRLQGECHELVESSATACAQPVLLSEAADEVATRFENRDKLARVNRAMWGLITVDDRLGPLMPGEVAVVAARPGMGKTAWGFQMLRHSAELERPSMFVSLEMGAPELANRDLARLANIDSRKMRWGDIDETDAAAIRNAQQSIGSLPLWLYAPHTATLGDIRGVLIRAIETKGIRLACIDYLSLIETDHDHRRNPRHEQVAAISRGLKRLAKELDIPLVVLQQLSREADGAEPGLKHLRESGAVEQDADIVMFLHHGQRDKKPMPANERLLLVPKFRAGPVGNMTIGWDGPRTEFTERPISNNANYDPAFDAWNNATEFN